ncbi:hypothetical protein LTR70_001893 [Exophiala xenobiotica]|uniref:Uncharacterized protein n=1 Tax=Lithohypha guttulata TaxID=1690604 RepID=A0ABR0KA31_9EURO|nr:hypothetical protein LTR24_005105 [Lithohypha guttulata]KAK5326878.1 hypothetical protein LTR70_001893 [Exophiala xenobiotica]
MSASVATSTVGLLDRHYSPQSVHADSNAPAWSDQMEVDRSTHERSKSNEADVAHVTRTEDDAQAECERRNTIGGLLAALATNATTNADGPAAPATAPGTANATAPQRTSASPEAPADSPISQASPTESQQMDEEGMTDNPNHARLLSIEPNSGFPPSTIIMPADPALMLQHMQPLPLYDEDIQMPFPPFDLAMDQFPPEPIREPTPINIKRQYDAFARLEFADGIFYLNTYQCELGRDQHAYKDALRREREAQEAAELEKHQPNSSSGKASQRVQSMKAADSQIQGSVVSERGGFAGVDEQPIARYDAKGNGQHGEKHSSQASNDSIVRPAEVLHNPSLAPFDYHKDVIYHSAQPAPVPENKIFEDEQPAPVTLDHMPDPSSCPLIPIHPTLDSGEQSEADCMRAISRRHVRIYWDWDESSFFMKVQGKNGAFFEDNHVEKGKKVKLHSGARIQISAVEFKFRLPITKLESPVEDDASSLPSDAAPEASPNGLTEITEHGQTVKLKLKLHADGAASAAAAADAEKKARRGPGRPPKNGYMSQREMKEIEKAEKEKQARVLHGGPSPPILQPRKSSKSQLPKPEIMPEASKPEKRKYTKRKREDGEEEEVVIPSIEAQEETPVVENPPPQPTAKRARTKSFSPPYKPLAECSQEDLARPPHNYAVLLYMVLSDTGEITLRQIYKQMQSRWPYFKHVVDSDGWTSSVRHNLNQEVGKLFERGRKEGKGFTWLPKPNAMEEYQAQKNKRSNAPPAPKPRPPPQRPSFPPSQGQQLTWQNSGTLPQSTRPGDSFVHQGPWPPQQPNGARPPLPGAQMNGSMPPQVNGQRSVSGQPPNVVLNNNPNYIPPVSMLPHYFGRQAPKFIPVTFEGLAVINRFQQSMMTNVGKDEATQNMWIAIFDSAKKRCLHGATASSLEGGETNDERTIIGHIKTFVGRYQNPAFEGFAARTASPAAAGAALRTGGPSTATTTPGPSGPVPVQEPHVPQSPQTAQVAPLSGQAPPGSQTAQPAQPAQTTPIPAMAGTLVNGHQPVSPQTSTTTASPSIGLAVDTHSHPPPASASVPQQPKTQAQSLQNGLSDSISSRPIAAPPLPAADAPLAADTSVGSVVAPQASPVPPLGTNPPAAVVDAAHITAETMVADRKPTMAGDGEIKLQQQSDQGDGSGKPGTNTTPEKGVEEQLTTATSSDGVNQPLPPLVKNDTEKGASNNGGESESRECGP